MRDGERRERAEPGEADRAGSERAQQRDDADPAAVVPPDRVDEADEESFPASDPPAWMPPHAGPPVN